MPSVISSSAHSKKQSDGHQPTAIQGVGFVFAKLTLVASALSFIAALLLATTTVQGLTAPLERVNRIGTIAWGDAAQTRLGAIVGDIILAVLGLLGVVFVVLLTYGGFLWLTSAGEEDKAKKARDLITNSIIGILIVIAAYGIAYFVLSRLATAVITQ